VNKGNNKITEHGEYDIIIYSIKHMLVKLNSRR